MGFEQILSRSEAVHHREKVDMSQPVIDYVTFNPPVTGTAIIAATEQVACETRPASYWQRPGRISGEFQVGRFSPVAHLGILVTAGLKADTIHARREYRRVMVRSHPFIGSYDNSNDTDVFDAKCNSVFDFAEALKSAIAQTPAVASEWVDEVLVESVSGIAVGHTPGQREVIPPR